MIWDRLKVLREATDSEIYAFIESKRWNLLKQCTLEELEEEKERRLKEKATLDGSDE